MVTGLDGDVLSTNGDVRGFFNSSPTALHVRDLLLYFMTDRVRMKLAIAALAPNLTIERNLMIRPRERKPLLARAIISRAEDDKTVFWEFTAV